MCSSDLNHENTADCCVAAGTVGYVRGERTEMWGCSPISPAYSQCVPWIGDQPPSPPSPPPPPAGDGGMPCQEKPYGGCGGTHTTHSSCCIAAGTKGYDMGVHTEMWACRFWKGRAYSQCLPTAAPPSPELLPSPEPLPTVAISPKLAKDAKKLTPSATCQTKTYGRCDGKDFSGCCIEKGTTGHIDGKATTSWACETYNGQIGRASCRERV